MTLRVARRFFQNFISYENRYHFGSLKCTNFISYETKELTANLRSSLGESDDASRRTPTLSHMKTATKKGVLNNKLYLI